MLQLFSSFICILLLQNTAEGEKYEWTTMYKEFAEEAKEEGFTKISKLFEMVAIIEKKHEERYLKLLKNLEDGVVFKKDDKVYWKCRNCGYINKGTKAPEICPVCDHPKSYFEIECKNW